MNLSKEEEAIIIKMRALRVVDYLRYKQLIDAFGPLFESEAQRITREKYGKDKIIRFPGTGSSAPDPAQQPR